MAGAALTVENAPRNAKELMNCGRYSLRNLAYELGLVTKEKPNSVTKFDKTPIEKRADIILEALMAVDKKSGSSNGGNEKATTRKKREPVKVREPVKPKEETETKSKSEAVEADLTPVLAKLQELINRVEEIDSKLDDIRDVVGEVREGTMANMGLNAIVGEHIMQGASIEELVKDGIETGKTIELPEEEVEDDEGNE